MPGTPRDVLLALRAAYLEQAAQLTSAAADLLDESHLPESADEEDLGEANGAGVERERLLVLAEAARRGVDEVDEALARLDAGTYGRCVGCGRPIPAGRLEALPCATHCVECKSGGLSLRARSQDARDRTRRPAPRATGGTPLPA